MCITINVICKKKMSKKIQNSKTKKNVPYQENVWSEQKLDALPLDNK